MAYALCGGGDARHVEFEPVKFSSVHAVFKGLVHVECVGSGNVIGMVVKSVGDGVKQFVFASVLAWASCDCALRAASPMAHTDSNTAVFMAVVWFCGFVMVFRIARNRAFERHRGHYCVPAAL